MGLGKNNGSSIEGGIFAPINVQAAPLPKTSTNYSSVEGGARRALRPRAAPSARARPRRAASSARTPSARAPSARAPRPRADRAHPHAAGIFGTTDYAQHQPRKNNINQPSQAGGVFGGGAYEADAPKQRVAPVQRLPVEQLHVAGQASAPASKANLFDEMASPPLAPLASARVNPNASSVQGGIFGAAAPTPTKGVPRSNPNASSVQGGIFG